MASCLTNAGIFVSAVNPKHIKDFGDESLRTPKADKVDSRKIAHFALDRWAKLRQYSPMDEFLIMDGLIQRSPADSPVYAFMDKKRTQGKPYLVFMTAGANKFLRIYYGTVRDYLKSKGLWLNSESNEVKPD